MAFDLNFGSTNRLMKTLMWYFMQSRLGKESHERAMLRQQQYQTGIEERGIATHQRGLERIAETDKRMRERAEADAIRTIQMNSKLQRLRQQANMPQLVGEEASNQARIQYDQVVNDVSLALFNMMKEGDPKIEDFKAIVANMDPTQITSLSRQAATTAKFKEELPLKKRAATLAETRERRLAEGKPKAGEEYTRLNRIYTTLDRHQKSLEGRINNKLSAVGEEVILESDPEIVKLRGQIDKIINKKLTTLNKLETYLDPEEARIQKLTLYLIQAGVPSECAERIARGEDPTVVAKECGGARNQPVIQ